MKTTLNKIRAHSPCHDGWERLLRGLGKAAADDETLWIDEILDINGIDDALWCLRAVENCDREIRLYAVWCARRVQRLMIDPRSIAALDVAERHARGEVSDEELASVDARATAAVASMAWAAAPVAYAAWAAASVSAATATAAAYTTAGWTLDAAAWSARDTERAAQANELRRICREMREAGR
jgi:hypothetical protein